MSTTRESYTSGEWQTLQFAPMWTCSAVSGADGGMDDKEAGALAKEFREASLYKEPLVREVLVSVASDISGIMESYGADSRAIDAGLGDVANVLDDKAEDNEAANFKRAMLGIGVEIGQASGSWFGDKFSDAERRALTLVAVALRFSPE